MINTSVEISGVRSVLSGYLMLVKDFFGSRFEYQAEIARDHFPGSKIKVWQKNYCYASAAWPNGEIMKRLRQNET